MMKMIVLTGAVAMAAYGGAGDLTYTVKDLCAPNVCIADVLNDKGQIAGYTVNGRFQPFAIFSGNAMVGLEVPAGDDPTANDRLNSMNNAGVIVGNMFSANTGVFLPESTGELALAWIPALPTPTALILNKVFGWFTATANYINNKNQIVGNGPGDLPATPLIPGVNVSFNAGITDSGSVIGLLQFGTIVVYTPGIGTDYLPYVGGGYAFNSRGQVAFVSAVTGSTPSGASLYTPGKGIVPLPNNIAPFTMNDSEVIVAQTVTATPFATFGWSIYDASGTFPNVSGQPVPLNNLVPANSGWQIVNMPGTERIAINNAGEILVTAMNPALYGNKLTSVLLIPSTSMATPVNAMPEKTQKRHIPGGAVSGCAAPSFNGTPVGPCANGTDPAQAR